MKIHKPPHRSGMQWPSDEGWPFSLNETYVVYFDEETGLPLSPIHQSMRSGIAFGLELLYPDIPWTSAWPQRNAFVVKVSGYEHKKNQKKIVTRMRQWGRAR